MNHILRDIKLHKLTGIPLSEEASKLIKFWDGLWADMEISIDTDEGVIECWKESYACYYFRQVNKKDFLRCDYNKVWIFFKDELELNHDGIQKLIHHMVNETLNCRVNLPTFSYSNRRYWWMIPY